MRAILKIGYACNNNCIMCHADNLKGSGSIDTKDILLKIQDAKRKGCTSLYFSGGEPTIDKNFPFYIKYAHEQGLTCGVITNGRMLAYKKYLDMLVKHGLSFVYISLLGSTRDIHDKIAQTKSFDNTISGIQNVLKIPSLRYMINVTVLNSNMHDLTNITDTLHQLGVRRIKFSFVDIKGKLIENNKKEVPKISVAAKKVKSAIDYALHKGMEAYFDGFPFCTMQGYTLLLDNLFTNNILLMSEAYESSLYPTDHDNRIKPEICDTCELHDGCIGIEKGYMSLHGLDELSCVEKARNSKSVHLKETLGQK